MKHTIFFVFAVVIAVFFTSAFTSDAEAQKILDGKYFKSSYNIPYLDDATAGLNYVSLLIRAETGWRGGWVKVGVMAAGVPAQTVQIITYSGARMGVTNTNGLSPTNFWVRAATSNLGGIYVGSNGTTTYTIANSTNTNTNGANADAQCLYAAKSNRVLYTLISTTNGAGADFANVSNVNAKGSPCSLVSLGSYVDTYKYVNLATPQWGYAPSYFISPDTYTIMIISNAHATLELTNINIDLEFRQR